jgi:hypothetical protein
VIRRGLFLLAVTTAAVVGTSGAAGKRSPSLEFRPSVAEPGDIVTARVSLTPGGYVAPPRPGGPRVEVVLVPARLARIVSSADEDGVVHVATIQADVNWRGTTTFRVPDLPAGRYVGAYSIAGSFYAPRSVRPLDLQGFNLRVAAGPETGPTRLLGILGASAVAAVMSVLLVRRRMSRVGLPAQR